MSAHTQQSMVLVRSIDVLLHDAVNSPDHRTAQSKADAAHGELHELAHLLATGTEHSSKAGAA